MLVPLKMDSSDIRYNVKPFRSENGDGRKVAFAATPIGVRKGELSRWVQAAADRVGGLGKPRNSGPVAFFATSLLTR